VSEKPKFLVKFWRHTQGSLATTSREATKTHFLIDTFTMTQTAETPGIQDFSKAKIAGGGAIEGMESEVELKRLVSATLGELRLFSAVLSFFLQPL
jgi:hypothetical protein